MINIAVGCDKLKQAVTVKFTRLSVASPGFTMKSHGKNNS